jgi:hydroxypyruvate isomerase
VRFDVNINTLFTDAPLLDRFALAREAGFDAVESWWPTGIDLDAYASGLADADLELVLVNFTGGDLPRGDRGVLGDLERFDEFRENVPVALDLATATGCRRTNALVGLQKADQVRADQLKLAVENVQWAADLAADRDIQVLIEPLNPFDNGPTLIQTIQSGLDFISDVGRSNVALQFDAYHVERTESSVPHMVRRAGPLIGHVQIADAPGRGTPGTGAMDFAAVFQALRTVGYDGHIGLEYVSDTPIEQALQWLPRALRSGFHSLDAVIDVFNAVA